MSPCEHPPRRLYSWYAWNHKTGNQDILCIACCDCGESLLGHLTDAEKDELGLPNEQELAS